MVLKHALLAAVFTGIAAMASAQTAPPANHPVPQGDVSANAVIGAKVRNANNEMVGSVRDLYVDSSGNIKTVVLSIGDFFGSKDVAVKWTDIKQNRDGKSVKLTTNLSKDQLNSLPDYKYDRREPSQATAPK